MKLVSTTLLIFLTCQFVTSQSISEYSGYSKAKLLKYSSYRQRSTYLGLINNRHLVQAYGDQIWAHDRDFNFIGKYEFRIKDGNGRYARPAKFYIGDSESRIYYAWYDDVNDQMTLSYKVLNDEFMLEEGSQDVFSFKGKYTLKTNILHNEKAEGDERMVFHFRKRGDKTSSGDGYEMKNVILLVDERSKDIALKRFSIKGYTIDLEQCYIRNDVLFGIFAEGGYSGGKQYLFHANDEHKHLDLFQLDLKGSSLPILRQNKATGEYRLHGIYSMEDDEGLGMYNIVWDIDRNILGPVEQTPIGHEAFTEAFLEAESSCISWSSKEDELGKVWLRDQFQTKNHTTYSIFGLSNYSVMRGVFFTKTNADNELVWCKFFPINYEATGGFSSFPDDCSSFYCHFGEENASILFNYNTEDPYDVDCLYGTKLKAKHSVLSLNIDYEDGKASIEEIFDMEEGRFAALGSMNRPVKDGPFFLYEVHYKKNITNLIKLNFD